MNKTNYLLKFIICLLVCLGGGWLTGLVTQHGIKTWYPYLAKPYGTPPSIIFPIVWTILYIFMAISLTLLWISPSGAKRKAFIFFTIQIILNFSWSYLFFYLQSPGLALVDILCLGFFILLTIISFREHTLYGSYLLIPYLVWVMYAFYLNLFIWINN